MSSRQLDIIFAEFETYVGSDIRLVSLQHTDLCEDGFLLTVVDEKYTPWKLVFDITSSKLFYFDECKDDKIFEYLATVEP